jgi:hypothetical protein
MATKSIVLLASVALFSVVTLGSGQGRQGPKDRNTIAAAKLDPSFASTALARVILLPFGNELDYTEGAMILEENFIASMRQKHPEITIAGSQEAKQLIQDQKLGSDYRAFLGTYANTGVATVGFLEALGKATNADGVFLGQILGFGVARQTTVLVNPLLPIWWSKNKAVVGMQLTLLRTKDGRELWVGSHAVQGEKNENVKDLAKVVCDVFAAYFGRVPY